MDLDPASADRALLFHLPANLVDQITIMGPVPPPTADSIDGERSPRKPSRGRIQPSPNRPTQFVDLPDAAAAHVEAGEQSAKPASCVDADEVPEVQHRPADLDRVADHRGLPAAVRPWRRIDREPEGSLAVLVGEGTLWIEHSYKDLKDELGLDHFEGRSWRGWHHHVTLTRLAYAFLVELRQNKEIPT